MVGLEQRLPIAEVRDLLRIGEVLPFRVLDAHERLLLNIGQRIASERQFELLVERGAWVERLLVEQRRGQLASAAGAPPRVTVQRIETLGDRWERALWDLDSLLRRTAHGEQTAADWLALADALTALIDRDVDLALFVAVRQEDRRFALYPLAHSVHAALLALLAARGAGWPTERQRSLVAAALSMNVGMFELQGQMAEQDTPPSKSQLDVIRAHPLRGVQLLRAAGIADFAWLRAVAEHHERADGSGYPRALVEVADEARLLRMADVYMAKITPRALRPPLPPQLASRQLFQQEPGSALAVALIKAIGVHPPGALVTLASGEVAVVKRRAATGVVPTVLTLSDRKGAPSATSRELDTREPAFAISGPCVDEAGAFARVPAERVYGLIPA